jgi:hypothetical protein
MAFEITEELNRKFDERYVIVSESGCWIWTGMTNGFGYGRIKIGNKLIRSHRYSYVRFNGEIPRGKIVCHACDVRFCVNPDHLWLGTYEDNNRDRETKGRGAQPKGVNHPRAKLTDDQVMAILRSDLSSRKAALAFGVSQKTVLNIRHRKNWQSVTKHLA